LASGNPDRAASLLIFTNSVLPAYPEADQDLYLRVLAEWGRRIHAPVGGVRQRLFPQALLVDLLDALNLRGNFPADDVMRDIGLFSRMLQDVESVYLSVDSAARFGSVSNFLNNVAEGGYDVSTEDVGTQLDAVTVSTVHQCKGLEYPVVFLVDVEPRRFPRARSSYSGLVPQPLIADSIRNGVYLGTMEAEARLFYTGLTRAERFLYVTGSASLPGARRPNRPSQFMLRLADAEQSTQPTDMPAGLVQVPGRARVDETTLPTSFSDVRYYLRCPMDYRFRKCFGFSPPVPELFGYGRVVHVAVEKLHELFPNAAPTAQDARRVVNENFHLKHVSPSRDPVNRPGAYERAQRKAEQVAEAYVGAYQRDFTRWRQIEARFEIPAQGCLITGAIDLIMRTDDNDRIVEAEVLDFKTMEGGEDPAANPDLEWTELSLQIQLYARAAREVLGENAAAGAIHLLKDNQRVAVPIDQGAVDAAMQNIEWAVTGILRQQFPMRPEATKCERCDFNRLCPKREQPLSVGTPIPPAIHTPAGERPALAVR
jgi:DNA helicase-2/ATP-dependent DNA helicase PcrA